MSNKLSSALAMRASLHHHSTLEANNKNKNCFFVVFCFFVIRATLCSCLAIGLVGALLLKQVSRMFVHCSTFFRSLNNNNNRIKPSILIVFNFPILASVKY